MNYKKRALATIIAVFCGVVMTNYAAAVDSPTQKTYDLYEVGLFQDPKDIKNTGILGTLSVSVSKTLEPNGATTYSIQAQIPAIKDKLPLKLIALDLSTGTTQALRFANNAEGLCFPKADSTPQAANFSCSYSTQDNSFLGDNVKIQFIIFMPDNFLFNKNLVVFSELLAVTDPSASKPDPNASKDCHPPNYWDDTNKKCISIVQPKATCDPNGADFIMLLDGTCGKSCGTNQVQLKGKCQCQNGYVADAAKKTCVVDPALDTSLPAPSTDGGGSCSLIRSR